MVRRGIFFFGSLSIRYEKVQKNIDQTEVRRMAGHAAQVLVECVELGQGVHSMKSSIPVTDSIQEFGLLLHQTDVLREIADRLRLGAARDLFQTT